MPWKETLKMNQKTEFALKSMSTENFRELCREYGISAKTGYKWKQRFMERGLGGGWMTKAGARMAMPWDWPRKWCVQS